MRTINEQVSVSFVTATVSDAICMMPIVDGIVDDLARRKENAEKRPSHWELDAKRNIDAFKQVQRQLSILLACGFVPSNEDLADTLLATKLENIYAQWKYEDGKLVEESK